MASVTVQVCGVLPVAINNYYRVLLTDVYMVTIYITTRLD